MSQQQTDTVVETAKQRVNDFRVALSDNFAQSQLQNALAENSAAFAASLVDLVAGDKSLQECEPKLVIMQAMKAAVMKLPIIKSLGFAYIVAYKGIPSFQIGYKGLIQLAIRTGKYKHLNAGPVYEGEFVQSNKLTGEFDLSGIAKSETVIGYFAHFELLNGFSKTLFMTKDKVTAHAARYSKSFNMSNSPWKVEFDAMAVKTVLRNLLSHFGILSVEMANVLGDDDDAVNDEIQSNANKGKMGFGNPIPVTPRDPSPAEEYGEAGF